MAVMINPFNFGYTHPSDGLRPLRDFVLPAPSVDPCCLSFCSRIRIIVRIIVIVIVIVIVIIIIIIGFFGFFGFWVSHVAFGGLPPFALFSRLRLQNVSYFYGSL